MQCCLYFVKVILAEVGFTVTAQDTFQLILIALSAALWVTDPDGVNEDCYLCVWINHTMLYPID